MVVQEAVNFKVVGSSPTSAANYLLQRCYEQSNDKYEIGELVKVRLFGTRIHTAHYLSYPYFSYGVIIAKGISSYDDKEGYFVFVQKLEKVEFFKIEWMKKVIGEKNESDV